MKKSIIPLLITFTFLMILSSFHSDSLEYVLRTRIANFDFFHIAALIIITRLVWWR